MTDISLFKLMECGNSLMTEAAHLCVLSILYNTNNSKIVKNILKQTKSKHALIRMRCTEYMLIELQLHPKATLDKYQVEI